MTCNDGPVHLHLYVAPAGTSGVGHLDVSYVKLFFVFFDRIYMEHISLLFRFDLPRNPFFVDVCACSQ